MKIVNIGEAKAQFSRLVDEAAHGAQITLAKAGKPVARLVPIQRVKCERRFGLLKGRVRIGSEFDAPLPATVLGAFEGC
jgi:prevent-host-death family protein